MWGDVIREQKSDIASYRYGYQGQFAEKDDETGWDHFELREYDPVVGRWTAPDPMGQFFSPYMGMGNNPIFYTDPRGGCVDAQGKVIPCNGASDGMDGFHTTILPEMTVSAGVSFDAMTFEYDYAGTFAHYQKSFPEFAGMSHSEAVAHWNATYSDAFYKQWQESVQREKDRENVAKLAWFIQGFITAGTMGMGALGGSNLATPKTFSYSPRGMVTIHGNSLNSPRPTWGYKLYNNDGTFLKNGIISKLNPELRNTKSLMQDKHLDIENYFKIDAQHMSGNSNKIKFYVGR